jgi:hypothetical protein
MRLETAFVATIALAVATPTFAAPAECVNPTASREPPL